jgi:hypothetical protein
MLRGAARGSVASFQGEDWVPPDGCTQYCGKHILPTDLGRLDHLGVLARPGSEWLWRVVVPDDGVHLTAVPYGVPLVRLWPSTSVVSASALQRRFSVGFSVGFQRRLPASVSASAFQRRLQLSLMVGDRSSTQAIDGRDEESAVRTDGSN